jgi:lysyl-tRNA synthetase class II
VFLGKVVPTLTTSVHITHLPTAISRSAVADHHDPRLARCFATYINGRLICSGSTLLNDPFEYRERISACPGNAENAQAWGKENHEEFAVVLERGMPPAAVMRAAVGRLVSQFTDHNDGQRAP